MNRIVIGTSLFCCLFSLHTTVRAQGAKLSRLLASAPASPNSMVYIHIPSLRRLIDQAGMDADLPSQVNEVWMISELDPIALQPKWELGYSLVDRKVPSIGELAKKVGGYVDTIDGKEVVWSPREAYLLPIDSGIGFLRPARRPLAARVHDGASKIPVPDYLKRESRQPESYLSMMVGMDLERVFSPVMLESQLKGFDELYGLEIEEIAELLSSVKGFTIIIGRKSLEECILSFTFASDPQKLKPIAGRFLDEILKRNGTAAPEVSDWEASVEGNKLELKGAISESSLNGLLAIHTLQDQVNETHDAEATREPLDVQKRVVDSSLEYFGRVTKLVDRVRKYEAQTTGYRAKWNDLNARRIDELNTLGVDEELQAYAADVSQLLRGNSVAIRNLNARAGQQKAASSLSSGERYATGGYRGFYGGAYGYRSGYYNPNSSADYQRVISAQASSAGFTSFKIILAEIDKRTGEIRRAMTQKYNYQF